MSALLLKYDADEDRLLADVQPSTGIETIQVRQGKITLRLDQVHKQVESFEVADFRYFVSYHLLDKLFGDEVVRAIAAFQSAVTGAVRASGQNKTIQFPTSPRSSRRVVEQLLRAA